ncbi:universal stress protein [Atopobiaceae bacterium SGI.236]
MANYKDMDYDRVFVSLDGTDRQDKVLERAILVAANNNADLYIGHVIDSTALETAGTYPVDLIPELERGFRASIADGVARAEAEPGVGSVKVLVRCGRIRETLKEEMIDQVKPDVIVCGARGLSPIKYALLGSISTFLLRSAPCDILVVK